MLKKLNIYKQVHIIGIAKKLEAIYFPNDSLPILISKKSESLKLLQFIRNEAHRFAISYHRSVRGKKSLESSLDKISGIGEKTKFKLLKEFGSISKIKKTDFNNLKKNIGALKAKRIKDYLKL